MSRVCQPLRKHCYRMKPDWLQTGNLSIHLTIMCHRIKKRNMKTSRRKTWTTTLTTPFTVKIHSLTALHLETSTTTSLLNQILPLIFFTHHVSVQKWISASSQWLTVWLDFCPPRPLFFSFWKLIIAIGCWYWARSSSKQVFLLNGYCPTFILYTTRPNAKKSYDDKSTTNKTCLPQHLINYVVYLLL